MSQRRKLIFKKVIEINLIIQKIIKLYKIVINFNKLRLSFASHCFQNVIIFQILKIHEYNNEKIFEIDHNTS